LRIEPADRPAWPKLFTRPWTRLLLPAGNTMTCVASVVDITDDGVLVLECDGEPLDSGTLKLVPDEGPLRRMCEAIDALLQGADEAYPRLLTALARPESLPEIKLPEIDPGDEETRKQREAVALGVTTPDIALIHGPPGTGKTTVICRIVEKLVKKGQRILLVAPTHVALDNVLERIGESPGVIALRLGTADNVDPLVRDYMLPNRARELGKRLLRGLEKRWPAHRAKTRSWKHRGYFMRASIKIARASGACSFATPT
jgi:AAA domain